MLPIFCYEIVLKPSIKYLEAIWLWALKQIVQQNLVQQQGIRHSQSQRITAWIRLITADNRIIFRIAAREPKF